MPHPVGQFRAGFHMPEAIPYIVHLRSLRAKMRESREPDAALVMGVWSPKANSLFLQAIEVSPSERRAGFLDEACANDPALRAEVEQLLRAHDSAGSFLERPLLDDQRTQDFAGATDPDDPPAASPSARAAVSLDFLDPCEVPGRLGKIGPYEVIDVIGVGGMGVVLRAYEPKLNRIVAVKVMAPQFERQSHCASGFSARRRPPPPSPIRTSSPSTPSSRPKRRLTW